MSDLGKNRGVPILSRLTEFFKNDKEKTKVDQVRTEISKFFICDLCGYVGEKDGHDDEMCNTGARWRELLRSCDLEKESVFDKTEKDLAEARRKISEGTDVLGEACVCYFDLRTENAELKERIRILEDANLSSFVCGDES